MLIISYNCFFEPFDCLSLAHKCSKFYPTPIAMHPCSFISIKILLDLILLSKRRYLNQKIVILPSQKTNPEN